MSENIDITPEGSVAPIYLVPLTSEEVDERQQVVAQQEAEARSKSDAIQSAMAKLSKLGLTEEEARAIIGI